MRKKVLVIFGIVLLTMMSCASTGNAVKAKKQIAAGQLQVSNTVVLNAVMAERKRPSMGAYWGQAFAHLFEGGLFTYPIAGGAAIADFKRADKSITEERPALQAAWLDQLDEDVSDFYAKQFNTKVIPVSYPFANKKFKINYFTSASSTTKQDIVKICQDNQADYVVAIIGKIEHGTGAGKSTAISTQIKTTVCIFDKNGKIVSSGTTQSPMLVLNYASLGGYMDLYATAEQNTVDVIKKMSAK